MNPRLPTHPQSSFQPPEAPYLPPEPAPQGIPPDAPVVSSSTPLDPTLTQPRHQTIGDLYNAPDIHSGAFHPQFHHPQPSQRLQNPSAYFEMQQASHSHHCTSLCSSSGGDCSGCGSCVPVGGEYQRSVSHPNQSDKHSFHPNHHRHHHGHHHSSSQPTPAYIESDEDEEIISDDYDTSFGGANEARHFDSVCHAFANYAIDSMREIARMESHFHSLSDDDKSLLMEDINGRVTKIKDAVINNQNFLNLILIDQGRFPVEDEDDDYDDYDDQISGDLQSGHQPSHDGHHSNDQQSNDELYSRGKELESSKEHQPVVEIKQEEDENSADANQPSLQQEERQQSDRPGEERLHSSPFFSPLQGESEEPERQKLIPLVRAPTAIRNISKIRSTLRQFVRDWSDEGKAERDAAYQPLLDALEATLPLNEFKEKHGRVPRVLCPGSGLGRLPFEVVRRGYACQGNEFSYFMLLGSNLILNCNIPPKSCVIQPYCLATSNRIQHQDHLVEIRIPDVCPVDVVESGQDFSMCAGEFVEVYWEQVKQWDGLLTCFFIDTAKNVLQYIRTIARILRPGALWTNIGPLLYHFSDMPNEISIELSWEEIRRVIERYFTIKSFDWRDAYYTTNSGSMMQVLYHCIFFVAIRNDVEVVGVSNPVY